MSKSIEKRLRVLQQERDEILLTIERKINDLRSQDSSVEDTGRTIGYSKQCMCGNERTSFFMLPWYCPVCMTFVHTAYTNKN